MVLHNLLPLVQAVSVTQCVDAKLFQRKKKKQFCVGGNSGLASELKFSFATQNTFVQTNFANKKRK